MFSKKSKANEKLVREITELIKKYDTKIREIYYIPEEAIDTLVTPLLVIKDKDNISNCIALNLFEEDRIDVHSFYQIMMCIHLGMFSHEPVPEEVLSIISELEEHNQNSIISLRQEEESQQIINNVSTTLNQVLEMIGDKPARSNKRGFYETDKLDAIEEIISSSDSPYHIVHKSKHCTIYGKTEPRRGMNPVLVSSHSDIVSGITTPYSELENGFYHGTYDNLGTNAAIATLMLNNNALPKEIYFAFTDEEETGKCYGATECVKLLKGFTGNDPLCVALDVTDEGYFDNCLSSVEGLSGNEQIQNKIKDIMFMVEPEDIQTFCVSKAKQKDNSPFPNNYISAQYTVFDESKHYANLHHNTLSFCLPTCGNMHGNSGLHVKEPVFLGYCLSLEALLKAYCQELTFAEQENYLRCKEILFSKAKELKRQATYPTSSYYPYSSYPYLSANSRVEEYDEEDDYDNEDISASIEQDLQEMASMYSENEIDFFLEDVDYNYGKGTVPASIARRIFYKTHDALEYDEEYDDFY